MLDKTVRTRIREIAREIATLRLDRDLAAAETLRPIQELAELESVLIYSVHSRTGRWELDRWECHGCADQAKPLLERMLSRQAECPLYYHPLQPPRNQRDRVVDALEWIEAHAPGTWETSPMCEQVLAPLRMQRYRQPRALLCDGPSVLAWFGGIHDAPVVPRQLHILQAFVSPMRRRLLAERLLGTTPLLRASLEVLLDRVGSPAFVVDATGAVRECNRAGQTLLDECTSDVITALRDAAAGSSTKLQFELIPVCSHGMGDHWIAVLRRDLREDRITVCVQTCIHHWRLTRRQADVLELVVRGLSNATIAAMLECVERTIELHVTALLDRAGVDSRAALVSVVLTTA